MAHKLIKQEIDLVKETLELVKPGRKYKIHELEKLLGDNGIKFTKEELLALLKFLLESQKATIDGSIEFMHDGERSKVVGFGAITIVDAKPED